LLVSTAYPIKPNDSSLRIKGNVSSTNEIRGKRT
jgi:hypothetical protein